MAAVISFPSFFISFIQTLIAMPQLYYAAVIALFFGIVTASKPGLIVVPAIAAIVYVTALAFVPAFLHHADLVVPAMDAKLAQAIAAAYVVFLIADSLIYAVKKTLLKAIG